MFINLSKNISLANVEIHFMHGLGIINQFSENLSFDSVLIIPSHGRMISAFADCLHFSGCRGFINIQNCHFKGSHDDPVNVHGTQLRIVETSSANSVKVRFMHGQTYGFPAFFAGDTVHFVHSASLQTYSSAIVADAKLLSEREMALTFTTTLPAAFQKDDCIENITWTPSLTVRNCLFEATNTRGLLVTTPRKVIIEGNTFNKTGMQAILIADDASSWFESGAVKDVTISRNTFINCVYNLGKNNYTIAIEPENHALVKNFYVHNNINIVNNTFITRGSALLNARSTSNLVFTGNSISRSDSTFTKAKPSIIRLTACDKVTIRDNRFTNSEPTIAMTFMKIKSVTGDVIGKFKN
ncbi:MAG: right-handed parallel beta-helix repeat-containing protein [Chitinophagaceae bacterium]